MRRSCNVAQHNNRAESTAFSKQGARECLLIRGRFLRVILASGESLLSSHFFHNVLTTAWIRLECFASTSIVSYSSSLSMSSWESMHNLPFPIAMSIREGPRKNNHRPRALVLGDHSFKQSCLRVCS